jgi:hypothetical protein
VKYPGDAEKGELNSPNYVVAQHNSFITNSSDLDETLCGRIAQRSDMWPWLAFYTATFKWRGYSMNNQSYALYDCAPLREHIKSIKNPGLDDIDLEDKEYISLFLQSRYYQSRSKKKAVTVSSASQAWDAFVSNYLKNPKEWRLRLERERNRFTKHSVNGLRLEIHRRCVEEHLPCVLLENQHCLVCSVGDPKLPGSSHEGEFSSWEYKIPQDIWNLVNELEDRVSPKLNVTASTQSQGLARPASGRVRAPRYSSRMDTQANERNTLSFDSCPFVDPQRIQQPIFAPPLSQPMEEVVEETIVPPNVVADEVVLLRQELESLRELVRHQELDLALHKSDYKRLVGELKEAGVQLPRLKRQCPSKGIGDKVVNHQRKT